MQVIETIETIQPVHKVNRRFSKQEDAKLKDLVRRFGENRWTLISRYMGNRNTRQCKDRWYQYLSPHVNQAPWTREEEEKLKKLVVELNGRWFEIAKYFNGRADSQIRNKWRTLLRRGGQYFPKSQTIIVHKVKQVIEEPEAPKLTPNSQQVPDVLPKETTKDVNEPFSFDAFFDSVLDNDMFCDEFVSFF